MPESSGPQSVLQMMDQIEKALVAPLPETEVPQENHKVTQRVRRHREKLSREGCARLDITIGADVLEKIKAVSKQRGLPLWRVAEEAFELLAGRYK